MVKHLYLMRHGETLFNVYRRIQGWCDSPLTELGIQQAIAARNNIKDIPFDHYYCSTAERAIDTLELVTENKVPYTRLKGLKERYFGVFEGQSEDLLPSTKYYDDIFPIYGGESHEVLGKRMLQTLTEVMNKEDHQCVLAVAHCGCGYDFLRQVKTEKVSVHFSNCDILHFTFENNTFIYQDILKLGEIKNG